VTTALAGLALAGYALAGCGSGAAGGASQGSFASVPAYVAEPFTHQQHLVAAGARLIVSDGCSACHLEGAPAGLGPNFDSFAGHEVTLANGRRTLVDEDFLRASLVDPAAYSLRGYRAAPMVRALARLQLAAHPQAVAELAAFIEQIGPEP
jgi:hypothetical protein